MGFTRLSAQSFYGLEVDNDLYFMKDYYYSSGINLRYGVKNTQPNSYTIYTLGQEVYNPSFRYTSDLKKLDYPYSGWLHISIRSLTSFENHSHSWKVDLGTSGNASFAKTLQNWYHTTFLNLEELSWVAQMPQKFLFNIQYTHSNEWKATPKVTFSTKVIGQLGTQKTFAGLETFLSLNSFSLLNDENPKRAPQKTSGLFLGINQELIVHDFAIDGPLDGSNIFELPLNSYRVTLSLGTQLTTLNWHLKAALYYRSADNSNQRHPWHPYLGFTVYKLLP